MRKLLSLLLACLLTVFCVHSVGADGGLVTYTGNSGKFIFSPGSEASPTDLFPDIKDVMPGDVLTQEIMLKNNANDHVVVKFFLKSIAAVEDKDFLSQLHMNVKAKDSENYLYDAPAGESSLDSPIWLGTLYSGGQVDLLVTLSVPTSLTNEYQNRLGKIDWVFSAEEYPADPVTPTNSPTPTYSPTPTNAAKPTNTPTPTNAAQPTSSPTPTIAVPPTNAPTPTIPVNIEIGRGYWVHGSGVGKIITNNLPANSVKDVLMDGAVVPKQYYDLYADAEGNLTIKFHPDYLDTLAITDHRISIRTVNGVLRDIYILTILENDVKPPQTGDDSGRTLWTAMALGSATVMLAMIVIRRRKRREKR